MILQVIFKDKNSFLRNRTSGLSLVELIIVISITVAIGIVAVPIYGTVFVSSQITDHSSSIVQTLRVAQQNSLAGFNDSSYGVFFNIDVSGVDEYILYQGNSYAIRDTEYDRVIVLDDALSISTTLSGDEVTFSKILGVPNSTGTITLIHSVDGVRTISINDIGAIEE